MTKHLLPEECSDSQSIDQPTDYAVVIDEKKLHKKRFLKWSIISTVVVASLALAIILPIMLSSS